jgi:azurin
MKMYISRRDFLRSTIAVGGMSAVTLAMSACGGVVSSITPTAGAGAGKTVKFDLTAGDDVAFNTQTLSAQAGSKITITFANKSSDKQFNWVLAQPGKMLRVVTDGQSEGEASGYVKQGDQNVIAFTKLLKPGESDTITFDAPAVGDYPFFCTFPGFYTRLNGTLTVK